MEEEGYVRRACGGYGEGRCGGCAYLRFLPLSSCSLIALTLIQAKRQDRD